LSLSGKPVEEAAFNVYWSRKTDSDHVPRPGWDVFRIGASEIQPFVQGAPRVLEIGCGAGELFEHLEVDRSGYLGIDFSRSMLDAFSRRHPDVRVQLGEADTFSTKERFDLVIVNNVVQYCAPWTTYACLRNCADALDEGGRIFVGNVPHRGLRLAMLSGAFESTRAAWPRRALRYLRALAAVALDHTDRIGYWYTPTQFGRMATGLELECSIFGCLLYPYRFTAVLRRPD
jgi:SAM-dependent methyltransferase